MVYRNWFYERVKKIANMILATVQYLVGGTVLQVVIRITGTEYYSEYDVH